MDPSTSTSQIGSNYLSLREAARELGVSERTVREYVYSGRLEALGGGHGRALYFHREDMATFRPSRRGPKPAGYTPPTLGPSRLRDAVSSSAMDWQAVLGTQEMARILAKPESKQAAAFEKAARAQAPHLVDALRARYPTLSGSTIKRQLRREVPDQISTDGGSGDGDDHGALSLIDSAMAREYASDPLGYDAGDDYSDTWDDGSDD